MLLGGLLEPKFFLFDLRQPCVEDADLCGIALKVTGGGWFAVAFLQHCLVRLHLGWCFVCPSPSLVWGELNPPRLA